MKKGNYRPFLTKSANISIRKSISRNGRSTSKNSKSSRVATISPASNFRFDSKRAPSRRNPLQKNSRKLRSQPKRNLRKPRKVLTKSQSSSTFNIKNMNQETSEETSILAQKARKSKFIYLNYS